MRLLLIGHHIVIGRGNSHWLDPIGKLETSRLNVARTQTGSKSASSTKHRVSSICSLSHFARKTRQILPLYFSVVRGCQRGFKLRPSARSEHLTKYSLDRQQYCYYCYTSTAAAGCGWVSISGNLENTIYLPYTTAINIRLSFISCHHTAAVLLYIHQWLACSRAV